jgi:hypothetical protein
LYREEKMFRIKNISNEPVKIRYKDKEYQETEACINPNEEKIFETDCCITINGKDSNKIIVEKYINGKYVRIK